MANVILGTDPNAPLAYAPILELHHPIVSMLGGNGCWLEKLWCLSKQQFPPPGGFLMTTMSKGWRDCKYILDITVGWIFTAMKDDWPAVVSNLQIESWKWVRLTRVMGR